MKLTERFEELVVHIMIDKAQCFVFDPFSQDGRHLRAKFETSDTVNKVLSHWSASRVKKFRVTDVEKESPVGLWPGARRQWQREVCFDPILEALPRMYKLRSFEYAQQSSYHSTCLVLPLQVFRWPSPRRRPRTPRCPIHTPFPIRTSAMDCIVEIAVAREGCRLDHTQRPWPAV
jgi:hypothetical protein